VTGFAGDVLDRIASGRRPVETETAAIDRDDQDGVILIGFPVVDDGDAAAPGAINGRLTLCVVSS